jgi:hypothetical protein
MARVPAGSGADHARQGRRAANGRRLTPPPRLRVGWPGMGDGLGGRERMHDHAGQGGD